jgi:hypothetical protein
MNLAMADVIVLFDAPLDGEVTIKQMLPAYCRLFHNQLVVLFGVSVGTQGCSLEPGMEPIHQDVTQVVIGGVRVMSFEKF